MVTSRHSSAIKAWVINFVCFGLGGVFLVPMELPFAVLWRLEALDRRMPLPPEALELAYP